MQSLVTLSDSKFNPDGYWSEPIAKILYIPTPSDLELFDQNGFDLTALEQHYAYSNRSKSKKHREHRHAVKQPWFEQYETIVGPTLNHSLLFERKGYTGEALAELQHWAKRLPLIHKVIAIRPKWGLDFSMDYVDHDGNAFELLHWEWDTFVFEEIECIRKHVEPKLLSIDWADAAKQLLNKKDEWHGLDFFAQSDWKCKYFGIPAERFKMVCWE